MRYLGDLKPQAMCFSCDGALARIPAGGERPDERALSAGQSDGLSGGRTAQRVERHAGGWSINTVAYGQRVLISFSSIRAVRSDFGRTTISGVYVPVPGGQDF